MKVSLALALALLIFVGAGPLNAQDKADQSSEVGAILEKATQATTDVKNPFFGAIIFERIAITQVKAGDLDKAFATANRIDHRIGQVRKDGAFHMIGQQQLDGGDSAKALETAARITNGYFKAWLLQEIAVQYVKDGKHETALKILEQAITANGSNGDEFVRTHLLYRVAETQAAAGDKVAARRTIKAAVQIASAAPPAIGKPLLFREVAEVQAKIGDVRDAIVTSKSIEDHDHRTGALRDIVAQQARKGDISGAFETAGTINDPFNHAFALQRIVEAQADAGDIQGALRTAGTIPRGDSSRVTALIRVAKAQAKRQDHESAVDTFRQAADVAADIQNASEKARMLGWIATEQAEIGDREAVARNIQRALLAAKSIQEKDRKDSPLLSIVEAQSDAGDIREALQTTASMDSDFFTDRAYYAIAIAQARGGDIPGALQTAAASHGHEFMWRGYTLQIIASIQTRKGGKKEALTWAIAQRVPSDAALALLGIAEGILLEGVPVDPASFRIRF